MRTRITLAYVAATLLSVVVVGVCVWLIAAGLAPREQHADDASAVVHADADEIVAALAALATDPASLLPAALVEEYGDAMDEAIPPGTEVSVDPTTWQPSDVGGGVIEVTLAFADGTTTTVAAIVTQEDGAWKVLQTIELEDAR